MSTDTETSEQWLLQLADVLRVDADEIDIEAILELARGASHGVDSHAAPVLTFVAGYAAGLRGGGPDEIADAVEAASAVLGDRTR